MLTEYQTNLNDTIKDESKMSKIDKVQFIDDKTQVQIYKVNISDVIKSISKNFEQYTNCEDTLKKSPNAFESSDDKHTVVKTNDNEDIQANLEPIELVKKENENKLLIEGFISDSSNDDEKDKKSKKKKKNQKL
jgi:hypothetical protein